MAIQKVGQLFIVDDFSSGLIDDLSVSKSLTPINAVRKAINVVFDRPRGAIRQRLGYTKLGDTLSAGNTILGLHNYRSTNSSNHQLLASVNGVIYNLVGSTWTSQVTSLNTTAKMRFITYVDRVAFLNGQNTPQEWDGSGAWNSSGGRLDTGNWPTGTYVAAILNEKIITIDNDTAYLSSTVSSDAIIWTGSEPKNVKISPNDGAGDLTSVVSNGRVALLFKERGLYRYDEDQLQRIGHVGTPSHESVVTDDQGTTFFFGQGANSVGFYATNGGRPLKISRPITRIVEAISASSYSNISAYTDGSKVEWSVGSITLGDNTYLNASIVYSISDKTFTLFNKADSFRVFSQYIDSNSNITVVGGDTDGMIHTIDSGNTDNTTEIASEVESRELFVTSRGRVKVTNSVVVYSEDAQGLTLHLRTDGGEYKQLRSLERDVDYFTAGDFPLLLRGNELQFKLTAINSGTPWQFSGLEFPDIKDEGYRRYE